MHLTPALAVGIVLACVIPMFAVIIGARNAARRGGIGQVPPDAPGPPFDPAAANLTVRGGAWVNGVNVTWPGATLRIGRDAAELTAFACPPVVIRRAEATALRWRRGLFGRGLQFRTATGRLDRVTFWPVFDRTLPARLRHLGWS
jgi:hypothetical protein